MENCRDRAFSKEELAEAKRQIDSTLHKLRETVKTFEAKENGINRGEFRTFEAKVAKMANTYGSVDVSIELRYANGGTRPTSIIYTAIAPDGTIEKAKFKNHH